MFKLFFQLFIFSILLFVFHFPTKAQEVSEKKRNVIVVGTQKTLEVAKEVTVVVVGQTAKASWKTAKFVGSKLVKPTTEEVIKPLVVKTAPKFSGFLVKQTGTALQKGIPLASRMVISYFRYKLPL